MLNQVFTELIERLKKEKLPPAELSRLISSSLPKLYEEVIQDDNYYVIKRNGLLEEFQCRKIETSLAGASDEVGHPLGSRELRIICENVQNEAKKMGRVVHSWQIKDLALEELYKNKYYEIFTHYKQGSKGIRR